MEEVKTRGYLVAGVKYDGKPFGYIDSDGRLKGYEIDLMHEIAKRILGDANAVEFRQVFSSTRIVALSTGSVDIVAATMTITPERQKVVDFSQPYFVAHQAVIVPADSRIQKLSDLENKTILFVLGTTSEGNIRKRLPHAKYIGFKSAFDAFENLQKGQGDAMTTDDIILSGFLAGDCRFRALKERLSNEPYGLGLRHNTSEPLRTRLNQALRDMEHDGTLAKLKTKWVSKTKKSCQS
jgi:putative glutamine transport system substrate-binding protein